MAAWPASLPAPLLSGFAPKLRNNVLRTPMETGRKRARLLSREVIYDMPLQFSMTQAQLDAFNAFYQDANGLNFTANRFTATWDIGAGLKNYEVMLLDEPQINMVRPKNRHRVVVNQAELREL